MGCKHYSRKCRIQSPCCKQWHPCRLCHDEASDHEIDRYEINTIQCMSCFTVQSAKKVCENISCQVVMAHYYCDICHLWNDDSAASIYHCEQCKICRRGKGLGIDYFHCTTCKACLLIEMKEKHRCRERVLDSNCPICNEYLFTSTRSITFMPCRHPIHVDCLEQWIYQDFHCPVCFKALADLSSFYRRLDVFMQSNSMPAEYELMIATIFCNECEQRSVAPYHFLYHKCLPCGSYNTRVLSTYTKNSDETDLSSVHIENAVSPDVAFNNSQTNPIELPLLVNPMTVNPTAAVNPILSPIARALSSSFSRRSSVASPSFTESDLDLMVNPLHNHLLNDQLNEFLSDGDMDVLLPENTSRRSSVVSFTPMGIFDTMNIAALNNYTNYLQQNVSRIYDRLVSNINVGRFTQGFFPSVDAIHSVLSTTSSSISNIQPLETFTTTMQPITPINNEVSTLEQASFQESLESRQQQQDQWDETTTTNMQE